MTGKNWSILRQNTLNAALSSSFDIYLLLKWLWALASVYLSVKWEYGTVLNLWQFGENTCNAPLNLWLSSINMPGNGTFTKLQQMEILLLPVQQEGRHGWSTLLKREGGVSIVLGVKINCYTSSKGRQEHFQFRMSKIS